MDKQSQCAMILGHMKKRGSITAKEAIKLYGCMRLAGRIYDLKRMGIPVKSELKYYINQNGHKVSYAAYSLEG